MGGVIIIKDTIIHIIESIDPEIYDDQLRSIYEFIKNLI